MNISVRGEPGCFEKSAAWQTAIGLQDVDGLQTSKYLLEIVKEHIEGKFDIATAQKRIYSYYEQRDTRMTVEQNTKEADIVAARIAELLAERIFLFSLTGAQHDLKKDMCTTALNTCTFE